MRKRFVTGCIFFMLLCMTGCGNTESLATEEVIVTTEAVTETVEEVTTEELAEVTTEVAEEGTTEEMTVDVEEQSQAPDVPAELSDDLYSYQIVINGELYQLPMTFADLTAMGWMYENDDSEELDAYTFDGMRTFYNGSYEISADVINQTDSPKPYAECDIVGFGVSLSYNSGNDMVFVLPKGIQSGVATVDDVKVAYGEPSNEFGDESVMTLTYEEEYASKYVEFTFWDGVLESIQVKNAPF
ncbi:MAG: hypothetical protein IJP29_07085 [Lachnospiraceae bacterium]|nr:hypothetical protein [Lachnospiraceae bacterium]